jgi:phage head maturation protease
MEYRASTDFTIRDKAAGIVEVRSNQLECVDDYRSIFANGIWDRAVARDGKLPKVLVDHDGRRAGRVVETHQVQERGGKLFQHSSLQYNLRSQYGSEAFEDVRDGTDDEFSHGFSTLERKVVTIDKEPIERKLEARWFEVSQVLAGASPDTGIVSVRDALSLTPPEYVDLAAFIDYRATTVTGANKTPPAGYPSDSSKYGDPSNYKYPLDSDARIHAAIAYFNHSGQRDAGGYSSDEWASVGRRIVSAANKAFGGGYSFSGGNISTPGTAGIKPEEERAGAAISSSNRGQLQTAHDALAKLPGVMCDPGNTPDNPAEEASEQMRSPKTLDEYRAQLVALGIEEKES